MAHPLDGCRLKIARAEEHLAALERDIIAYVQGGPHRITTEREPQPDGRFHLYRIHQSQPPPARLSVLVGDALQDLRSALDHLAWELASLGGATPPDRLYFPIYKNVGGWQTNVKALAAVMPAAAVPLLEALQPYQRGDLNRDPLFILNELARADRHRGVHVIAAVTRRGGYSVGRRDAQGNFRVEPFTGSFRDQFSMGPVEDGAVIARFFISDPDPQVDVDCKFTIHIEIAERPPFPSGPVLSLLRLCADYVAHTVVPTFHPFFPPLAQPTTVTPC